MNTDTDKETQKMFPKINHLKKFPLPKKRIKPTIGILALLTVLAAIIGGGMGAFFTDVYWQKHIANLNGNQMTPVIKRDTIIKNNYVPQTTEEEKTIKTVKEVSPSVVNIIISKDVPIMEQYYTNPFGNDFFGWPFGNDFKVPQYKQKGTEKKEVGSGSGFIISKDGMILTNKHVVSETDAEYTVLLNSGDKYPAKVLARDPFFDLAIIKIDQGTSTEAKKKEFIPVQLGDSSKLQPGQTVIAIGNALGQFQNTVSVGVISGLKRNIVAGGLGGESENLEGIIQTDAAINPGNSGGPLLNLAGQVIGINVARSTSGENIGFSLPINTAKRDIEQVKKTGEIIYPFLGVYYSLITPEISKANNLSVDYGAWVGKDSQGKDTKKAVFSGSPAEKAGLKRGDIILEFDGKKITKDNPLSKIILNYSPKDKVKVKVLRGKENISLDIVLSKRTSD